MTGTMAFLLPSPPSATDIFWLGLLSKELAKRLSAQLSDHTTYLTERGLMKSRQYMVTYHG